MAESDKKITKQKIQKLTEKYEAEKSAGKILLMCKNENEYPNTNT